jgi:hypothetical protein
MNGVCEQEFGKMLPWPVSRHCHTIGLQRLRKVTLNLSGYPAARSIFDHDIHFPIDD